MGQFPSSVIQIHLYAVCKSYGYRFGWKCKLSVLLYSTMEILLISSIQIRERLFLRANISEDQNNMY